MINYSFIALTFDNLALTRSFFKCLVNREKNTIEEKKCEIQQLIFFIFYFF